MVNFVYRRSAMILVPSNGAVTLSGVIVEADISTGLAKKVYRLIKGGNLVN